MSSNDIADWFRRIPTMTKYWFTGSIVLPLLGKLGVVSIMMMVLDYSLVVHRFQVRLTHTHWFGKAIAGHLAVNTDFWGMSEVRVRYS